MPRTMRVEYPGAICHVMDRGDRREDIFVKDIDRQDFLKTLAEAWQVQAYCLMRNHFRVVLETPSRHVLPGRQSRPCPRTHRGGQPLRTEAVNAENAPESAIGGVLRMRSAPTGSVLWLVPIPRPRKRASPLPAQTSESGKGQLFCPATLAASISSQNLGFCCSAWSSCTFRPERNRKSFRVWRLRMRCTTRPSSWRSK
jgi:hypothetical protein